MYAILSLKSSKKIIGHDEMISRQVIATFIHFKRKKKLWFLLHYYIIQKYGSAKSFSRFFLDIIMWLVENGAEIQKSDELRKLLYTSD